MIYKGYTDSINFCQEDKIFYGTIERISDLVAFEGKNLKELQNDSQVAVHDYLSFITLIGRS